MKLSSLIKNKLKKLAEKEFICRQEKLIGKEIVFYGVRTCEIRKIVKEYFRRFSKEVDWLKVTEELLSTGVFENQMAGIFLLANSYCAGEKITLIEIKELITKYINNWAAADTISSEVVVKLAQESPEEMGFLFDWASSKNIWLKRVALVTLIKLKNKIEDWWEIAFYMLSFLKKEKEPILKKAMRWLQKEVSK